MVKGILLLNVGFDRCFCGMNGVATTTIYYHPGGRGGGATPILKCTDL